MKILNVEELLEELGKLQEGIENDPEYDYAFCIITILENWIDSEGQQIIEEIRRCIEKGRFEEAVELINDAILKIEEES